MAGLVSQPDLLPSPPPSELSVRLGPWLVLPVLFAYVALGVPLQLLHRGGGVWLSSILVFLGLPFMLLQRTGDAPATSTGLWPLKPVDFAWGAALGLANWAAWAVPLMTLAQTVLPAKWVEAFDGRQTFEGLRPAELGVLLLGVSVAAPVCEEFFFRGVVQRGLVAFRGAAQGLVAAAIVFGAMHFDPVGLIPRIELGVLFGFLALKRRSLWAAIGAHAANNAAASAGFLALGDVELPTWGLASFFVGGNVVLGLGLWRLARAPAEARAPIPVTERPSWAQALWPWAAIFALGLGAIHALDGRGVAVRRVELTLPLDDAHKGTPEAAALDALKDRVLAGQETVEAYEAARRPLSKPKR